MSDGAPQAASRDIQILVGDKPATLHLTKDGEIQSSSTSRRPPFPTTPAYHVLLAEVKEDTLALSYIKRRGKGKQSILAQENWKVEDRPGAQEWCAAVMVSAYNDVKPERRLRVFVNPHGGPGKARQIYSKTVEPIFNAARCQFETTFTERSKHASELAKNLSLDIDALVLLSGDGLLHEVYNGFTEHEDPLRAFATPVAPIPTGSANGMALNLLGLEDGFDVGFACLNAIKGRPMKQDICSMTLGDKRIFSYFSIAMGLMADLDLGTEHLRWMGDIRFILGYIHGVLKLKPCPITLEIKTAETDKDRMIEEFRARREAHRRAQHAQELEAHKLEAGEDSLPTLQHATAPGESTDEGWVKFEKPLVYLYSGSAPFVGRDLMQFPVAHASDGLIDIVVQELTTRKELLSQIDGADTGAPFWNDTQHYFKAHAYRVTPHASDGNLAVDGEGYPLQPFTVECHRALGALLSPTGHYAAEFNVSRPEVKSANRQAHDGDVPKRKGLGKVLGCC